MNFDYFSFRFNIFSNSKFKLEHSNIFYYLLTIESKLYYVNVRKPEIHFLMNFDFFFLFKQSEIRSYTCSKNIKSLPI